MLYDPLMGAPYNPAQASYEYYQARQRERSRERYRVKWRVTWGGVWLPEFILKEKKT